MISNKGHILKKHGAFYAEKTRTLDSYREPGVKYKKVANHLWCPSNNVDMLELDLQSLVKVLLA